MTADRIRVADDLAIPMAEISFRASRSGGPGGQHVNTSSTRVELVWDLRASPSLSDLQRGRLEEKLAGRINAAGELVLASSATRSQHRNREDAVERFADLVREALHMPRKRRKTKPSRASREARLHAKKRQSEKKRLRRPPED